MKTSGAGVLVLLVAGCGSDGGGDSSQHEHCNPTEDRVGTYLFHVSEKSGDCGPQDDSLVRFAAGSEPVIGSDNSCALLSDPSLSDGDCTIEQSVECVSTSGLTFTSTAITTQTEPDGSGLTGTLDFRATDTTSGAPVCHSVYHVTYTRQ